jgi:hypothetical protein
MCINDRIQCFMNDIINHRAIFVVIMLLGILLFYWFQWRPVAIRSGCHKWIVDLPGDIESMKTDGQIRSYNALFDRCLHEKGL